MLTDNHNAARPPIWRAPRTLGFFGGLTAFMIMLQQQLPAGRTPQTQRLAGDVPLILLVGGVARLMIFLTEVGYTQDSCSCCAGHEYESCVKTE